MIKNKSVLHTSFVILFISMLLNFPFPHTYPFGETLFTAMKIPIRFANGFHTVGIITLFLLIAGLYLLARSLSKFRGRIVFAAIISLAIVPMFLTGLYQKNFATGIYAVSYSSEESNCSFQMSDKATLHGECELSFENFSSDNVQFAVYFHEHPMFEDDLPMVSLMNNDAPYEVLLKGKENKQVHVETDIDVSDTENHIENGEATGVNITISSEGKSRDL